MRVVQIGAGRMSVYTMRYVMSAAANLLQPIAEIPVISAKISRKSCIGAKSGMWSYRTFGIWQEH